MNTFVRCTRALSVLVAAVALTFSAALRAETLDAVEKAISEKFDKVTSASYDMSMNMEMAGQGYTTKQATTGKCEMVRDGEKWKMRMESATKGEMVMAGNSQKTDSTSLMVVDGEFSYTLSESAGQKSAVKMKAGAWSKNAGGKGLFESLKDSTDLSAAPDETVDGQAAYVLLGKAKQGGMTTKYYFSKDNGMMLQQVTNTADGKPMNTTKFSNIKVNASIPADRFTFTPPAGVQVTDMTKQQ